MLGSCINVSQKNNLVIIKINENAKIQDIIPQIKKTYNNIINNE